MVSCLKLPTRPLPHAPSKDNPKEILPCKLLRTKHVVTRTGNAPIQTAGGYTAEPWLTEGHLHCQSWQNHGLVSDPMLWSSGCFSRSWTKPAPLGNSQTKASYRDSYCLKQPWVSFPGRRTRKSPSRHKSYLFNQQRRPSNQLSKNNKP